MSTKIESTPGIAASLSVSRPAGPATPGGATAAGGSRGGDTVALTGDAVQLQDLERSLSKASAVDSRRVDEVRRAITEGRYQVNPERIAAKLIQTEKDLSA